MDPILKIIADNPTLYEAVHQHYFSKFSELKPRDAETMPDEQLGALVRARLTGEKLVDEASREIKNLTTSKETKSELNPAR